MTSSETPISTSAAPTLDREEGSLDFTVVMPTRNRWRKMSRALRSALNQQSVSFEILVVDDASSDATQSVLGRVYDDRVRAIRLPRCEGVSRARNRAVTEARGKWLAFLDDDDFWAPNKLRSQLDMTASDRLVFVYSGGVFLDGDGQMTYATQPPDVQPLAPSDLQRRLLGSNLVATPSAVIAPTALVRAVGGFDEQLSIMADWDLWIRLSQHGRVAAVDEPLFAYVEHGESMHITEIRKARSELRYMARKHGQLCKEQGVVLGDPGVRLWLRRIYRGEGRRLDAAWEYARVGVRNRNSRDLARAAAMLLGERAMSIGSAIVGPEASAEELPGVDPGPVPGWVTAVLSADDPIPVGASGAHA
jgi:glycosyltransferase involved in cell wall biosynthesis